MFAVIRLWLSLVCLHPPVSEMDRSVCHCATITQSDGWCGKCQFGYLAGIKIESAALFDALDPHGHDINPASLRCEQCRKAYETHGYCEPCKIGFVRKQAFFSRLTYGLARGTLKNPGSVGCATCVKHMTVPGWCGDCGVGMVGHRAYEDRKEFEEVVRVRNLLNSAIERGKKCLSCAIAMINDGACVKCKVTFEGGREVATSKP